MAKIKMLTSASRDGLAIRNGDEVEYPDDEAASLVVNGLAAPVGDWKVVDGKVVIAEEAAKAEKKKPAAAKAAE